MIALALDKPKPIDIKPVIDKLEIVTGADGKAYWNKGGKKTELIQLELLQNRHLIDRELGIYGTLGVVCDSR